MNCKEGTLGNTKTEATFGEIGALEFRAETWRRALVEGGAVERGNLQGEMKTGLMLSNAIDTSIKIRIFK